MPNYFETKVGYVYGVFMMIILGVVVLFLLCDFKVLPEEICSHVNSFESTLTQKINDLFSSN